MQDSGTPKSKKKEKVEKPNDTILGRFNREEFIATLNKVRPGLSNREITQQATCVVFRNGNIITYNEEVMCSTNSGLPETFSGAVQASPLITILQKLPDEEVQLASGVGNFSVIGKNRKTSIAMETEVLLPVEQVEIPDKSAWKPLHKNFTDAISVVQECASKDQSMFTFTCIHIHPKFIEASDNNQLVRYRIKTGVEKEFLVRKEALKFVALFDFDQFAETERWIHFRTKGKKMRMSCLRYIADYEDLGGILAKTGTPTVLPKALAEVAERCAVFSSQNTDNNVLIVHINRDSMKVRGEGAMGFHEEVKKMKYAGPPIKFSISPKMLAELVNRHTNCEIADGKLLLIDGGTFRYAASLGEV